MSRRLARKIGPGALDVCRAFASRRAAWYHGFLSAIAVVGLFSPKQSKTVMITDNGSSLLKCEFPMMSWLFCNAGLLSEWLADLFHQVTKPSKSEGEDK
jgi:hypothetical protein